MVDVSRVTTETKPTKQNRVDRFLKLMNDRGSSDLHMSVGQPPMMRVHGVMDPIRYRNINEFDFETYLKEITPPHVWQYFVDRGDGDFAYEVPGLSRFRVNLFRQSRGSGAVFRIIPSKIYTLEQLGMPTELANLAKFTRGLVLVTGPTGSGKSTTLAAIIDKINATRNYHIITIEDPIEFVHVSKRSLLSQREVGTHATSFASALKSALREDPDLILVGEMRDTETVHMALTAAESGLLVFGTLHTNSAGKTVDRIINVFPSDEQDSVRSVLGETLRCVVAQQLLPARAGGRVAAVEIMYGSPALATMVRDGKTHQIANYIMMGRGQGMQEMDSCLLDLVRREAVDPIVAYEKAIDKKSFRKAIRDITGIRIGEAEDDFDEFVENQKG